MAPACVAPEPFVPPIWSEYRKFSQAMLSLLRLLVRQKGSSLNVPRPKTLMAAFGRPLHNTYRKFSLRSTCIARCAFHENEAALQQNSAILQQSVATLEFLRQGFTAQQTDLKRLSNQFSSLRAHTPSTLARLH
jgi:hypothetical protein